MLQKGLKISPYLTINLSPCEEIMYILLFMIYDIIAYSLSINNKNNSSVYF